MGGTTVLTFLALEVGFGGRLTGQDGWTALQRIWRSCGAESYSYLREISRHRYITEWVHVRTTHPSWS